MVGEYLVAEEGVGKDINEKSLNNGGVIENMKMEEEGEKGTGTKAMIKLRGWDVAFQFSYSR